VSQEGCAAGVLPKRILMATIGSLGDLHPMLALAVEFRRRGHSITVASTEFYRARVESLGIGFRAMRPNWDPTDQTLIAQCEDLKSGPEILFRRLVLPHLRDTYEDLLAAARDADLMLAGELCYAAPLVAEKLTLPWASVILSPCSFFSAHDPSLLVNAPALYRLRRAGWLVNRGILRLGMLASRHWWEPVRRLRRELGLRPDCDPLIRDKFSPDLVLALFSRMLAEPQPDWPRQTIQPGFVFFDRGNAGPAVPPGLAAFLAEGDAPIVFTLGSTAVHNPGNFYQASVDAARNLGRRALLIGLETAPGASSADVLALPYAPYSQVFPHAAAIVHQGGSGTTGQALLAGKPQLIVPYGWDQPDNGARIARLGTGLSLAKQKYSVQTAASALRRLLEDSSIAIRAREVGRQVGSEVALISAIDAIDAKFTGSRLADS
jgi:UDP:flavonoid glycosyltransferase YjiC (YdhE family)